MPMVDCKFSGISLSDELKEKLEAEITKTLQDTISVAFPTELGFQNGSKEFEVAHEIAYQIMPGWTWVTLSEARWAIGGKKVPDDIVVGRVHIFLLANAVWQDFRQEVTSKVYSTIERIIGEYGKKVELFVDVIEGEVDLWLPNELFSNFTLGSEHKLLKPNEVVQYIVSETHKRMGSK